VIIAEAEDSDQALDAIKQFKPDLVIADISLKDSSGLELTKAIKKQYPRLPVLIQSMHEETMYSERSLQAGAMGYIMKDAPTEDLMTAIRKVLAGQIYTSEKMATKLVNRIIYGKAEPGSSPIDSLSDRELEVFNLLGKGLGTSEIAERLKLSIKTVETYRAHLKEKLALADASELRQYAIQWLASRNE
jgi:DNA-binding NarL/FixJ family response regulator